MIRCILTDERSLNDYIPTVGEECVQELRELARPLRGARVLHLNAAAAGGGVAETLKGLAPLMCDLGLDTEWRVMRATDDFYEVTKAIHNGLQGMPVRLEPHMKETWLEYNRLNADLMYFNGTYDFVVVHDPQPAGVLRLRRERNGHQDRGAWIWRCHLDLTSPRRHVWEFLRPYVQAYDAAIFTRKEYFQSDLSGPRCFEMPPGIDPLSAKNGLLEEGEAQHLLMFYGIDPGRPFILKLSRFDPWKDFKGIIDIYGLVRSQFPDLQLVLVGGGAADDPEAWSCYRGIIAYAQGKGDIHILWGDNGIGGPVLNAIQQTASVVVQKSIREGFGLVVTEALWKGRPVVASDVGGITLQISHGETGYLARSVDDWVEAISFLLRNREVAARIGTAGRSLVQERFLVTRCLRDYLKIFRTFQD